MCSCIAGEADALVREQSGEAASGSTREAGGVLTASCVLEDRVGMPHQAMRVIIVALLLRLCQEIASTEGATAQVFARRRRCSEWPDVPGRLQLCRKAGVCPARDDFAGK